MQGLGKVLLFCASLSPVLPATHFCDGAFWEKPELAFSPSTLEAVPASLVVPLPRQQQGTHSSSVWVLSTQSSPFLPVSLFPLLFLSFWCEGDAFSWSPGATRSIGAGAPEPSISHPGQRRRLLPQPLSCSFSKSIS